MGSERRVAVAVVAAALWAACESPPSGREEDPPPPSAPPPSRCLQSPFAPPLDPSLVAFLPTDSRPAAVAAADAMIANNTIELARRPPWELPDDPDWKEDPFLDPTWVHQYQSLLFILDALIAYRDTGEIRYLYLAENLARRWLDDHLDPQFDPSWDNHVTANRTRVLLWLWEASRQRDPTTDLVTDLCRALEHHAIHLQSPDEYIPRHNHGYFQDEALLSLALGFADHPDSAQWSDLARARVADQIEYAVTDEGVHREHSPSYHAGMQLRFIKLDRLLVDLGIELRLDLGAVIGPMWRFSAYGAMPTGRAPLLGDSTRWFGSASTPGITDEALYSLSLGTRGAAPAEVDHVFADSGYAFFRDRWHPRTSFADTVWVAFVAAYFSTVHKDCDDLSVLLYGYGESWLTDSGLWAYDKKDEFGALADSPAGHNLVEVDGRSYYDDYPEQDPERAPPLITDYRLGADVSSVSGRHRFNPGVLYERTLEYRRPNELTVSDRLTAEDGATHDYTIYWHVAPDKGVAEIGAGRFRATSPYGQTMDLEVTASASMSCEIFLGAERPYKGWFFPKFLEAVPAPVIACTQRAVDATFATSVELAIPDPLQPRISPDIRSRGD